MCGCGCVGVDVWVCQVNDENGYVQEMSEYKSDYWKRIVISCLLCVFVPTWTTRGRVRWVGRFWGREEGMFPLFVFYIHGT